jgi:hypothetical protein
MLCSRLCCCSAAAAAAAAAAAKQSLLLGGLEEHTDTTSLRLHGLRAKVADVIKRSRQDKQLCTILLLSVLLVVLTMIALA